MAMQDVVAQEKAWWNGCLVVSSEIQHRSTDNHSWTVGWLERAELFNQAAHCVAVRARTTECCVLSAS